MATVAATSNLPVRPVRQATLFMLADNLSKCLEPALVLACVARFSEQAWGGFRLSEAATLVGVRICVLGLDRGIIWFHSRCPDEADFVRNFARALNLVFWIGTALAAVLLALQAGWLGPLSRPLASAYPDTLAYAASIPVQGCLTLLLQSFFNTRALDRILLVRNLIVPTFTLLPALVLSFTPLRAHGLAWSFLAGNLLGLALALKGFGNLHATARGAWSPRPAAPLRLLRFSLPIAGADVAISLAGRFDLLSVGRMLGQESAAAYSLASMIGNSVDAIRQSFDSLLLAHFSGGRGKAIGPEMRRTLGHSAWVVTALQIPIFFFALHFGRPLLGLLKPAYSQSYAPLLVLLALITSGTAGTFAGQLLLGYGQSVAVALSQGTFVLVSLVLNPLLVPRLGLLGGALAMGAAYSLSGNLNLLALRFTMGAWVVGWDFLLPSLAGAAIFLPGALAHIWLRTGLGTDLALYAGSACLYALHAHYHWRRSGASES